MAESRIQFVDSISDTAGVRLSLTSAPWRVLHGGTDVPPPPLRRALAQTLMDDGARIPASAYDNRVIRLRLHLDAATPALTAIEAQRLARELDRTTNILRWQPEPTTPAVYFRTFRSPDYAQALDFGINLHEITIELVAEPFALGLKQTLSTVTVHKDPANATNPCRFDLASTDVIGDVETPAQISISLTSGAMTPRKGLIAVRARGTPSAAPFLVQAESMSRDSDTTTQANSASFSGSGNNWTSTSFATSSMESRLWSTIPATPSVDARGRYRVFLRCRRGTSGSVINVRVNPGGGGTSVAVPVSWGVGIGTLDLGTVDIPGGMDPVTDGPTGVELPASGRMILIDAERVSGSGSLDVDYVLLVPADYRLAIMQYLFNDPNSPLVLDGDRNLMYSLDSGGNVRPPDGTPLYFVGGLPMLRPNQAQRIYFVQSFGTEGITAAPTTLNVTVSYWPRYISGFRPATT